jgi:hypothetical protein
MKRKIRVKTSYFIKKKKEEKKSKMEMSNLINAKKIKNTGRTKHKKKHITTPKN